MKWIKIGLIAPYEYKEKKSQETKSLGLFCTIFFVLQQGLAVNATNRVQHG